MVSTVWRQVPGITNAMQRAAERPMCDEHEDEVFAVCIHTEIRFCTTTRAPQANPSFPRWKELANTIALLPTVFRSSTPEFCARFKQSSFEFGTRPAQIHPSSPPPTHTYSTRARLGARRLQQTASGSFERFSHLMARCKGRQDRQARRWGHVRPVSMQQETHPWRGDTYCLGCASRGKRPSH